MKRKLTYGIVLILAITEMSVAQVTFEHVYGASGYDFGYSVTQTFDKGYAVAGSTSSIGNGSTDAYLMKTDSMGVFQWHRSFGGINIDQAYSIQETIDTGFIIAGFTNSFGQGGYDMYVIKTDKNGDTLWTKTYGGSNWDFAYSIQQTADSGYVIAGGTYSFGKGYEDMYLIKINSVGDTLWTKTYGGLKEDEARSVKQTKDGGYIITGTSKSFGDSNGDMFSVKTNSVGDTLWTYKCCGVQEDDAYDIVERNTGGYYIGGKTKSIGLGNFDGLIITLSAAGAATAVKNYGGSDNDGIHSITESVGGRLGLVGYTYTFGWGLGAADYLLYIENPYNGFHSGTYGGNYQDVAQCINKTKDKGYIICGNSTSYSSLDHIFLVKTDSNGVAPIVAQTTVTNIASYLKTNNNIKIYPNPAKEKFYVEINNKTLIANGPVTITITDMLGRNCYQAIENSMDANPIEISTSGLNVGVYIVNIQVGEHSINQKLIVEQ